MKKEKPFTKVQREVLRLLTTHMSLRLTPKFDEAERHLLQLSQALIQQDKALVALRQKTNTYLEVFPRAEQLLDQMATATRALNNGLRHLEALHKKVMKSILRKKKAARQRRRPQENRPRPGPPSRTRSRARARP
jgi:hypothetical protein